MNVGTTTPVGVSWGRQSLGVLDMAGNVWERTSTKWVGNYANYRPDDSPEGGAHVPCRGGSFFLMSGRALRLPQLPRLSVRQCGVSWCPRL